MSEKRLIPATIDPGAAEVLAGAAAAIEMEAASLHEDLKAEGDADMYRQGRDQVFGMKRAAKMLRQFIKQGWMPLEVEVPQEQDAAYGPDGNADPAGTPGEIAEADQQPYAPGIELLKGGA
jgi:hypothetical protein